jgi:hypothetical protein
MEKLPEDQKVVDLLTKLKNSNGGYPPDMLAARRRTYRKQMANVGLGIGIGAGLKDSAKGGGNGASAATTLTSKILEVALIAAIAIEAGAAIYLYRDKIANAIKSYISGPAVPEVTSPSYETSSANPTAVEVLVTPSITTSATPSGTPSGTSPTSVAGGNNQNNNNNTSINANATPNPGGNQGNQYGLTPKPIRTKDNSGGSSQQNDIGSGGGGGNNSGSSKNNKP